MKCELLTTGFTGDLAVVNAARVSHDKWHDAFDASRDSRLLTYMAEHQHWTPFGQPQLLFLRYLPMHAYMAWATNSGPGFAREMLQVTDGNVIFLERGSLYAYIRTWGSYEPMVQRALWMRYPLSCAAHKLAPVDPLPASPPDQDMTDHMRDELALQRALVRLGVRAAHPPLLGKLGVASFRFEMPIPMAREWFRSTHDLVRNEVSRRYVRPPHTPATFFSPTCWRKGSENIKQGSLSAPVDNNEEVAKAVTKANNYNNKLYNKMVVTWGVAPEQARFALPQSMNTTFIETGSLAAYQRIYGLRNSHDAQAEIQWYAQQVRKALAPLWPTAWA